MMPSRLPLTLLFGCWIGLFILLPPAASRAEMLEQGISVQATLIRGGCFVMGCGNWTRSCDPDEFPAHKVCLDDFYMGIHEVTVGEYREFHQDTGYVSDSYIYKGCFRWTGVRWENDASIGWQNPGFAQTDDDPVVCVSWKDAMRFAVWKSGRDGIRYRLPTEAEWEYAARNGGEDIAYTWPESHPAGNVANPSIRAGFVAWPWPFWKAYEDGYVFTAPYQSFPASAIGLHGMTGNVAEWCFDLYGADSYESELVDNPLGSEEGISRVVRGASWLASPRLSRVSDRRHSRPWGRSQHLGFRLASTPDDR